MSNIGATGGSDGIHRSSTSTSSSAGLAKGKDIKGNMATLQMPSAGAMSQAATNIPLPQAQPKVGLEDRGKTEDSGSEESGEAEETEQKKDKKVDEDEGIQEIEKAGQKKKEEQGRFAQTLRNMALLKELRARYNLLEAIELLARGDPEIKSFLKDHNVDVPEGMGHKDVTRAHELMIGSMNTLNESGIEGDTELAQSCYAAATDFRNGPEGAAIQAGYNLGAEYGQGGKFDQDCINSFRTYVLGFEKKSDTFGAIMQECGASPKQYETQIKLLISAIGADLACAKSSAPAEMLNAVNKELLLLQGVKTIYTDALNVCTQMMNLHDARPTISAR